MSYFYIGTFTFVRCHFNRIIRLKIDENLCRRFVDRIGNTKLAQYHHRDTVEERVDHPEAVLIILKVYIGNSSFYSVSLDGCLIISFIFIHFVDVVIHINNMLEMTIQNNWLVGPHL